ncbi:MAG TPA: hypothetical protein DCY56_05955 [Candidatus Omnitrophica bacterium]|nr:hypothetical protein [Candidatus Omnitrophota bacterium]
MAVSEQNIRNIAIYAVPKFLGYGINFVTLPILTRILVPEDFGVVILASIFPAVAVGFVTCGLTPAAQRYYFEYREDKEKLSALYFSAQVFLYLFLIISTVAVFFLKDVISRFTMKNNTYGMAIFITYIAAYLGQIVNFYLSQYQNMEKAKLNAFFATMLAVCSAVSNILLVWYFKMSYMGLIYGLLISTSIVCLTLLFYFNKNMKVVFSMRILLENIRYGLQVLTKSLTGVVNKFFDKYMLNNMISISAVGIFNIGQTIGNSLFFLMNTVWSSLQPVCYREVFDRGDKASVSVGRLFTIFSYAALIPLFLLILFAEELVSIIAPASYHAAIDVIVIICSAMATQVFGMYAGVQYAYNKKAYLIFPITVLGVIANVGANIALIPRLGLIGASFSIVIYYLVTNGLLVFVGQKLYKIKYEWKTILVLFAVIMAATVSILVLRSKRPIGINLYMVKLSYLVLFVFIGLKAKIITKHSARKIINAFKIKRKYAQV